MSEGTYSVFVALVGRPNVGKSSMLNALIGEKAAIVSPKPQTTRTRITGILTKGNTQFVFFDTPGIHRPRTKLGRRMAGATDDSVADGDVTVMLFEPAGPLNEVEQEMAAALGGSRAIGVVNKADKADADALAARLEEIRALGAFSDVLAASALTGQGLEVLLALLKGRAVEGPFFFDPNSYTDQPEKQLVAEMVREKLLLHMQDEIPHGTAVLVERFKERPGSPLIDIDVTIYCERKSHKGMIIGKGGAKLKQIASEARQDIEELLATKVNLQCWVKVRDKWRDNERMLADLGFTGRS